jgi:hypothetical protein
MSFVEAAGSNDLIKSIVSFQAKTIEFEMEEN